MSGIVFEDMVKGLCKSGEDIVHELTGEDCHMLHMAVGIAGEAGELLDAIYRKPIDRDNVLEELGDLEFYMEGLRQGLGVTREETLEANIAKLGKRYKGHSYSDQAAIERADKFEEAQAPVEAERKFFGSAMVAPFDTDALPEVPAQSALEV